MEEWHQEPRGFSSLLFSFSPFLLFSVFAKGMLFALRLVISTLPGRYIQHVFLSLKSLRSAFRLLIILYGIGLDPKDSEKVW